MNDWSGWALPDEAINRAHQFETDEVRERLAFGDFVNDLALELQRPVVQICRRLAYEAGGSAETYRDVARVAAAVTGDLRDMPLSYSQFRACLSSPDPAAVMAWAVEQGDVNGGRPASVEAIYLHVLGHPSGRRSLLYRRFFRVWSATEKFLEDSRIEDRELREIVSQFRELFWARYKRVSEGEEVER